VHSAAAFRPTQGRAALERVAPNEAGGGEGARLRPASSLLDRDEVAALVNGCDFGGDLPKQCGSAKINKGAPSWESVVGNAMPTSVAALCNLRVLLRHVRRHGRLQLDVVLGNGGGSRLNDFPAAWGVIALAWRGTGIGSDVVGCGTSLRR